MQYITQATLGNAKLFGDLTVSRRGSARLSNATRGLFGGGNPGSPSAINTIDYITISSLGDAIDFGDCTVTRWLSAGVASATRGIFGGGFIPSPAATRDTLDYVTIASTGNATDFGNLKQQSKCWSLLLILMEV